MTRPNQPDRPTVREIAALTVRLRRLTEAGADADDAEREAFLADKHALLDRIAAPEQWHPRGSARLDLPTTDGEQARRDQLNRWHEAEVADHPEMTQEAP